MCELLHMSFTEITKGLKSAITSPARPRLLWSTALSFAALIGSSPAVQAAGFNFTYAPGTTLEQMTGFEMAGNIWSSYLTDDVTINIYVETTNLLPENVIGGALPGIKADQEYGLFRSKLSQDRTSAGDYLAYGNLPGDEDFTAMVDGNVIVANEQFDLTRANAKALGMLDSNPSGLDGFILMNDLTNQSTLQWDYDFSRTHNPVNNTLDFLSVGLHEVGHILGFVSGVDDPGWLKTVSGITNSSQYEELENDLDHTTPLDMFRYSTQSAAQNAVDLSIGENTFFSMDGGATNLADFSTGQAVELGGDGYQASHWKQQDNTLGIMDPLLNPGQRREVLDLDLTAMDLIGWDLQPGQTDLTLLHTQAKEQLAQRLGVTVNWLDLNPTQAALLLSQDQTQAVESMIQSSQIYEWGYGGWWQEGSGFLAQVRKETLNFPASATQLDETQTDSTDVPEPTTTLGLLSLGILAMGSLRKHRGQPQ